MKNEENGVHSLLATLADMEQRLCLFRNSKRSGSPSEILSRAGHKAAMQEISSWPKYRPTPLVSLPAVAANCGIRNLWYKDESLRFGLCSFKALGGAYAVLRVLQRKVFNVTSHRPSSHELRQGLLAKITRTVTVATATDGNHGRSVAWGAQMFNCRCVVYVPRTCSRARESAIAQYGAKVVRTTASYDDTVRFCATEAWQKGFTVVSDTSWPGYVEIPRDVMHGYTLLVAEVLNQLPAAQSLTHVFVQGGVGGLAASVCAQFSNEADKKAPAIIVVEPEGAACLLASARAGRPTPAPPPVGTLMAGLDCGEVSILAWNILTTGAFAFVTVPDEVVAPCMRLLASPTDSSPPIVAGESAVAGFAALLLTARNPGTRRDLALAPNSRVLVIGTEGNTDAELYEKLINSTRIPED